MSEKVLAYTICANVSAHESRSLHLSQTVTLPAGAMANPFEHLQQLVDAGFVFAASVADRMAESKGGDTSQTAQTIMDLSDINDQELKTLKIALRDHLILQVTHGNAMAKDDLNIIFAGPILRYHHSSPHIATHHIQSWSHVHHHRRDQVSSVVITRRRSRPECSSLTTTRSTANTPKVVGESHGTVLINFYVGLSLARRAGLRLARILASGTCRNQCAQSSERSTLRQSSLSL